MLEFTEADQEAARLLKTSTPFRDWHIVKTEAEVRYFDSKRKAVNFARKQATSIVAKIL